MVKKPPAMQETWVGSLGGEDPLEKAMATQGISVLPCKHFKQENVSLSLDSTLDSILFKKKKKNQNKRREKQEQPVLRTPKYQNLTFPLFFSRLNYKKYVPLFNLPTPANLSFPLFFNKG